MGTGNALSQAQQKIEKQLQEELARKVQAARKNSSSDFERFGRTYFDNPAKFAHECIKWPDGEAPTFYQDEIWESIPEYERVAVRGPHGLGKCLHADDLMQLADGSLVPAKDLIGKTFPVVSVDTDLNPEVSQAIAVDNGVEHIIEITTDKGRIIRRTFNHPLWADRTPRRICTRNYAERLRPQGSWVNAAELIPGSVVAVCLYNPGERANDTPDTHIKLAAYLLGDGGTTSYAVTFTQADSPALSEFEECCSEIGCALVPEGPLTYRINGADRKVWKSRGGILNPLRLLVREWGMDHKSAADKAFPAWVWNLNNHQLSMFLSRLFACDGWITSGPRSDGRTTREIGFCSISEQLAKDVQRALLRLGVQAENRKKRTTCLYKGELKVGTAWTVAVHDCENIRRFAQVIGIFGKEQQVSQVVTSCDSADDHYTQKWRTHNLPNGYAWEKVQRVRIIQDQPTVLISVPGNETFLTDFVEHNSCLCSISILWFGLTREALQLDWKLPVTASVGNQLKNYLWPEVKKWSRRLDWKKIGRPHFNQRNELLTLELHLIFGQAFCVAPEEPGKIEGAHADHLYFCYDEAKLIPDGIWDAAEGAFSGAGPDTGRYAFALAISTPGEPTGRFHAIHQKSKGLEAWKPRHVKCEEAIRAGRISERWVEEKRAQWGEKSALFQQKVLGEFASSDADSVIPLDWVEFAANRYEERTAQVDISANR